MKKQNKSRKELVLSAHSYVLGISKDLHGRYLTYTSIILFSQGINMTLSVFMGKGIDVVTGSNTTISLTTVLWTLLVLAILRCFTAILDSLYNIKYIVYDIEKYIHSYVLDKLFGFSPGQVNKENTGFKLDTFQKGASAISELMQILSREIIPLFTRIVISLSIILYINWIIALVVFFSIIIFMLISIKVNNYFLEEMKRVRKLESISDTKFFEIIKNLRLVIMMSTQKKTKSEYTSVQTKAYNEGKKVWKLYNVIIGLSRNLVFEHSVFVLVVSLVLKMVISGQITIGDVAVVMSMTTGIYSGIGGIGTMQRQLMRHSINITRLKDLIEQKPECADIPDAIELENPRGEIKFDKVTFAYSEGKPHALKNVSFEIKQGETVAFVGHSGSGKSTIVSLLLRSHKPQGGEIFVDDLPLESIQIDSLRRRIGIVSQHTMLWDGTVRQNILYGLERELKDGELESIIQSARVDEFRERLGDTGLDTEIGENGIQLSGGQCQRIAIARVLARDPKIIILDEATSALDYQTEAQVFTAMQNALKGRTGIIVAHRLGTVRHADRIIVLHKGEVVGEGKFEDLSQNNPFFKELIGSELR